MKIIRKMEFENKYSHGKPRIKKIKRIVIHGTAGFTNVNKLYKWMLDGERADNYRKNISFFHFAIGHNGAIIQLIDLDKWCYHSHSGDNDEESIGIELCNPSKNNSDPYTDEQYKSLYWLLFDFLYPQYLFKEIAGHARMMQKYSPSVFKKHGNTYYCPGNFDWNLLSDEMSNDFSFKIRDRNPVSIWNIQRLE